MCLNMKINIDEIKPIIQTKYEKEVEAIFLENGQFLFVHEKEDAYCFTNIEEDELWIYFFHSNDKSMEEIEKGYLEPPLCMGIASVEHCQEIFNNIN